jgi:hypothetical protein
VARLLILFGLFLVVSATSLAWTVDGDDPQQVLPEAPVTVPSSTPESTPEPTAAPETELPPPPPPLSPNRLNCDAIRGTDYLSGDERNWFLSNCLR